MELLTSYQQKIIQGIRLQIPRLGSKTVLRDACEYALMNGGKRLRPTVVLMIAEALGHGSDVIPAALAIEYFHTASLVADDLPCMDDDDERRNNPSVHKKYGETIAMLVSYALIAAGYGCLAENAQRLRNQALSFSEEADHLCVLALENATYNTGLMGATGGQFMDVFPSEAKPAVIKEIIHKKTVSLFEISFVSGWLFGGGNLALLSLVKKAASHYGTAFQIADDVADLLQDNQTKSLVNYACCFGEQQALKEINQEIKSYQETLDKLNLSQTCLMQLTDLIHY